MQPFVDKAVQFARSLHIEGLLTLASFGRGRETIVTFDQDGDCGAAFVAGNAAQGLGTSLLIGQQDEKKPRLNKNLLPGDIAKSLHVGVKIVGGFSLAEQRLEGLPEPTIILDAGPDVFAVWRLSEVARPKDFFPAMAALASRTGGVPAHFVPLPGTSRGRIVVVQHQFKKQLTYTVKALSQIEAQEEASEPLTRADQITEPPTRWLWSGYIPVGTLAIIMGPPKIGKSQVAIDIAARLTRAGHWPDGTQAQVSGGVAIFETEDSLGESRARAEAAGAELKRLMISNKPRDLSTKAGIANLERELDELEDLRLLILSPVRMFFGFSEAHKQVDMRNRLAPILSMAERRGIAILGVAHREAGKGGRSAEDLAGPKAIAQRARLILNVMEDTSDPIYAKNPKLARRLLVHAGSNNGPDDTVLAFKIAGALTSAGEQTSRVQWSMLSPEERERGQVHEERRAIAPPREPAADWLRKRLQNGPVPAKVVEEEVSATYGRSTIYRAMSELGVYSRRDGWGGPVTWELPKDEIISEKTLARRP